MVYERELKLEKEFLKRHFEKIGARVKFRALIRDRRRPDSGTISFIIDINIDKRGPYFDIAMSPNAPEFEVLQTLPKERHLLLYCRDGQRFLCGHDERNWFVAPINGAVSSVIEAALDLFDRIDIPSSVYSEIHQKPDASVEALEGLIEGRRVSVLKAENERFVSALGRRLGKGEAKAIALACPL